MSDVVGSASFELRATKDKLAQDIKSAEGDLKGFGDRSAKDIDGSAGKIGASIGRMASMAVLAVTTLVSVLGLAAVGAFNLSVAAIKSADAIADTARRIGIGTDALQEWRHVAQQTGADAKDADKALDAFSTKLAQASAGTSKEAARAFSFLGIGRDQLRGFKSVEEALDHVTDRIKDLRSEADRAAVAEALGLGPLSNALRDSAVDVAALRNEARELGIVMDSEMIQRASKAQGEFDRLAAIIDGNLKSAFIDLAPAIMAAISLIADLARSLADAMDQWRALDNRTSRGLRREDQRLSAEQTELVNRAGAPGQMRGVVLARGVEGTDYTVTGLRDRMGAERLPSARRDPTLNFWENMSRNSSGPNRVRPVYATEHFDAIQARRAEIARELAERSVTNQPPSRTDTAGGGFLTLPPERTRVDRAAEREARRRERVEQEIYRARQRLLQVAEGDLLTAQERYDLTQDQLKLERDARDAAIASKAERGEIKAAERRSLEAANAEADALEDRVLADRAFREIEDERVATERLLSGLAGDLLSLQSGAARTARERRAIELELLEIAQRERRDALKRELDRTGASAATRAEALGSLDRIDAAERGAAIRGTMTPLDQWRDQSLKTAGEVSEAFENIAARGLDSLNDGIVDAIMNSKSLGEVFSNVARQILADLLKISVRRGITEPLAAALFGGGQGGKGGGSGGGWMSAAFNAIGSAFGGGKAGGGRAMGGTWIRAGEHGPENIFMPKDGHVFPNGGMAGGAGGTAQRQPVVKLIVDEGGLFQARVEGIAGPIAVETGGAAFSGARNQVPADMAKANRYSLSRPR